MTVEHFKFLDFCLTFGGINRLRPATSKNKYFCVKPRKLY
jgi:hypothetical protein